MKVNCLNTTVVFNELFEGRNDMLLDLAAAEADKLEVVALEKKLQENRSDVVVVPVERGKVRVLNVLDLLFERVEKVAERVLPRVKDGIGQR